MSEAVAPTDPNDILPAGTRVLWYEIERVLGRGGFAITYLATDTNLRQPVALKEYLPMGLGQRVDGGVQAKPGNEKNFAWGRERFLSEAQTLARFKHRNIVRVVSFFEANNTAYLAMEFEAGQSLAQLLEIRPQLDAATLMAIVHPLMDGLEELHRAGFIHRDIKPANIYLRRDGSPVLLDFGAARQALGGQTQSLTSLLSPGYAPLEQYFSEKDRQGPWSDIYALAAVMYRAVGGHKPPEASLRSSYAINGAPDPLVPAQQIGIGRYPLHLLSAIDLGLRLREKERPQSLAEWRAQMEAPGRGPETVVALDVSILNFDAGVNANPSANPSAEPPAMHPTAPPAEFAVAFPAELPAVSSPHAALPDTALAITELAITERALVAQSIVAQPSASLVSEVSALRPVPPADPERSPTSTRPPTTSTGPLAATTAKPVPPRWSEAVPLPESVPARRNWKLPLALAGIVVAGLAYSLAGRRPALPPAAQVVPAVPALPASADRPEMPAVVEPRPTEPAATEAPALVPPPPAEAAGRPLADGAMQACKADAETYCAGITPGDGRFAACMRDNLHRFSEACRPLALQRFRPRPPRN